ncbi:MAG TPA: aminotransferase class III-fold pyridoxal phosphate-dependent enzyme, partial [Marmoricola sp.]|nr:aminotransferase class III-fold pyridoxal phosphate-dependent enzyme [Marmoricola sp.]
MDNLGHSLWHQQAHMPSAKAGRIVITSGHGAWLTTSDGRQLLDAPAGLWHANIGHGREEIALAAADQIRKLETYHTFGRFTNEPALRLADRIAAMSPIPDGKVMLTSGGSDSVELACKLARRHWQLHGHPERRFILSRDHAYHGLHTFGTSITGLPYNREGYGTESLVPETARIDTHDIAVVRRQIEALGPDKVAAVIAEPVVGTGGVFGPTEGYFAGLQEMAQEFGFLLIADEVITGFGRCGTM